MKDRSPRKLSRREALVAITALVGSALACAYADVPIDPIKTEPARTPVPSPTLPFDPDSLTSVVKATPLPSGTPAPTQTETATIVPTATQEKPKTPELMNPWIGNIYLGNPFNTVLPKEVAEAAELWGGEKTFTINDPHLVLQNELTEEEAKTMNPRNIITSPGVGLIFQTDNRRGNGLKHLVVYGHSGYSLIGEELPLNFFKRLINKSPETLIGTKLSLTQEGVISNFEVVHYVTVPEANFNSSFFNYKNSDDPTWRTVPLFLSFNAMCKNADGTNNLCLGINTNTEPFNGGDDLITFVGCYGPEGDLTSGRMLVTVKLLP